jgi:hypothetical protein
MMILPAIAGIREYSTILRDLPIALFERRALRPNTTKMMIIKDRITRTLLLINTPE